MGTVNVDLDGVSKRFRATTALRDVDLAVRDGEFFTLVGPSGCGKTTTLRLLAGFEAPSSGSIRFDGTDVGGLPPDERDVGIVFQNYALFPHMTVRENVAYGLRFADPPGGADPDARVAELLDLVDMAGMGDRDPDALSGGQQQRVALARALAPGPSLLLLDEPMSALDARLRERLRVQVREIQRELGITTVYVTHDQAEALAISDRVAVLQDGRVEQVGTPETVYREPASRFVAEFVGDNNLFEAAVPADDPSRIAIADGVTVPRPDGAPSAPGDLTLCVRPEAISIGGGPTSLTATVESVEFLGDAYRIHCAWRGRELVVRGGTAPEPGSTVELGVDPEDVRVVPDGG
ncbi:MAG: ABC transporter ATP-binding protein [Halobacteriaceae archaeon]